MKVLTLRHFKREIAKEERPLNNAKHALNVKGSENIKGETKKAKKHERFILQKLANTKLIKEKQNQLRNGSRILHMNISENM
jgi:hypothetical protein